MIQDNPALVGHGHQEPRAELRPAAAAASRSSRSNFTDKGREAFQNITREIAQRGQDNALPGSDPTSASQHFAIVLDNELVSAPTINYIENPDGIDGGTGAQISGSFTIHSAQDLAKILEIGALPIRLELISRSQVSASLGAQALDQGVLAGAAGFLIVALFLIVFYRVLGVIAVLAMGIYGLYFYALVELIPIVLTLPGIAGLILTLGVAADANIVIFERVKEELRAGPQRRAGDLGGLQEGPDGDRRRERRHVPRRLHPLHPRHGGRQGLRAHARRRRHPLALHRGARHAGDALRDARDGAAALARGARVA